MEEHGGHTALLRGETSLLSFLSLTHLSTACCHVVDELEVVPPTAAYPLSLHLGHILAMT
jgi:hypothetical protein